MSTTLGAEEADLYEAIYRCESCSHLTDPKGVFPFASRSAPLGQTVAVSHFGNIRTALVWLLLTNPRGSDRNDSNVGLTVQRFATNRSQIAPSDVPRILQHFSDYDFDTSSPDFWEPWKKLLDGLTIRGKELSFKSGGICAVDLIKCPTIGGWMGYVMTGEGKEVWANCHELKQQMGHHFLARQIKLHEPLVLIRPGTAFNGKGNVPTFLGEKRDWIPRKLNSLFTRGPNNYVQDVRCLTHRLTIELGGAGDAESVSLDTNRRAICRDTTQRIIDTWL